MVAGVMGQILVLCALAIVGLLVNRLLRIELTLACLVAGFVAGLAVTTSEFDTGIRAHNLQPIVFFIILPVLIFEAAWHLKLGLLRRWLLPVIMLATLGVIICALVTAGLVFVGIGHAEGFPWIAALLTGAILSATDPVAVMAQLRSQSAAEDLSTLFEGESLFNDATAIVLFTIVIGVATQMEIGNGSYVGFFALVFFGGVLFGLLAGLLTSIVVLLIHSPAASRLVLVFSAFATFYVAEHTLHVSGIMAVMVAALVARFSMRELEGSIATGVAETWEWLGLFLNSLLFVIMGLVITVGMFEERWLAMLIAIGGVLVARAMGVLVCSQLSGWLGRPIPWGWQILLMWGGLRGAIAIALVLSLPVSLPYWWTIQSMVFGVVLFSLVVQGTSNPWLVRKYGQPKPSGR